MYYNLKAFGSTFRQIRLSQNMTQKDICDITHINEETLRKIENGLVVPKQETLDLLSLALNIDIAQLFLKYRIDHYDTFNAIKKQIDIHLESCNFLLLENDLKELDKLLATNMNDYFKNQVLQLNHLVDALIIKMCKQEYTLSLEEMIIAMRYTLPNFTPNNYAQYFYNKQEIHILMNIGLTYHLLNDSYFSVEILIFCSDFLIKNFKLESFYLLSKIHYNLSYKYHQLDNDIKALEHANLGIQYAISDRSIFALTQLYFRKGIAEYRLGMDTYKDSLLHAKFLSLSSGQEILAQRIINNCKKFYNIEL